MQAFEELEQKWAEFNNLDPQGMVACSSGTAALHLALEALQLPQGSEVIASDFNMIAVPRAIAMAGLNPVFVDCDNDLLIDPKLWIAAIDGPTECVIFTHIYGRQCQFPKSWDDCASTVKIVEDLAEAHGIKPHKQTSAACWSFYKNKIVAGEEGGAVWFRDPKHAVLARQLRSLGFTDKHDFTHVPRGHNYRMSNAHAALVLDSLLKVERNVFRRRMVERAYNTACPDKWRMPWRNAPWVYDIRIPGLTSVKQDEIVAALQSTGVAARHAFKPMLTQPEFHTGQACGIKSWKAAVEVIYLPLTPRDLPIFEEQRIAREAFALIERVLESS